MSDKNKVIDFLKKYKPVFWCMVSKHYNFTSEQYEKFSENIFWNSISHITDFKGFSQLVKNKADINFKYTLEIIDLKVDENFINDYKKHLDWESLSKNKNIEWTEELIDKYASLLNWNCLSINPKIKWSRYLIEKYSKKISWSAFFVYGLLDWSEELFDYILSLGIEKYLLSNAYSNKNFPWRLEYIEKNINNVNWECLSSNSSIPWSEEFIDKYKDKLSWNILSSNTGIPFSVQLIERYLKRWNWDELSLNISVPWSNAFIKRYFHLINWENLSKNLNIKLDEEILLAYSENWDYKAIMEQESFIWSEDLIEKYSDILDWDFISGSDKVVFTEIFIERNKDKINWDNIGRKISVPWSIDFILKYEKTWDWFYIAENKTIWEKVFKDYIDDNLINEIFNDKTKPIEIASPEFPQLFERIFQPKYLRTPKWFSKMINQPFPYSEDKINHLSNLIASLYSIRIKNPMNEKYSEKDDSTIKKERLFINTDSNDFWSIYLEENKIIINFGKVDTLGEQKVINYSSLNECFSEYEKLISAKVSEGFEEKIYDVDPILYSLTEKLKLIGKKQAWKPIVEDKDGSQEDSKFCGTFWLFEGEEWPMCSSCEEEEGRTPLLPFLQLNLAKLPTELWSSYGTGLLQFFNCPNFCDSNLVRVIDIENKKPQKFKLPKEFNEAYIPKSIIGWRKLKSEYPESYLLGHISEKMGIEFTDEEDNFRYQNEELLGMSRSEGDKLGGYPSYTETEQDCEKCQKPMNLVFEFKDEDNIPYNFGYMGHGFIYQCPDHKDIFSYIEGY